MTKAYTAVVRNHFFRSNSSKLEPTGMKFYTEMSAPVKCSPPNFWCSPLIKHKMAANNPISQIFLSPKQRIVSPTESPANFHEI